MHTERYLLLTGLLYKLTFLRYFTLLSKNNNVKFLTFHETLREIFHATKYHEILQYYEKQSA